MFGLKLSSVVLLLSLAVATFAAPVDNEVSPFSLLYNLPHSPTSPNSQQTCVELKPGAGPRIGVANLAK